MPLNIIFQRGFLNLALLVYNKTFPNFFQMYLKILSVCYERMKIAANSSATFAYVLKHHNICVYNGVLTQKILVVQKLFYLGLFFSFLPDH